MTYDDKLHQSNDKYGGKICWRTDTCWWLLRVQCIVGDQDSRLSSILPGFKSWPFTNLLCDLSKLLQFSMFQFPCL